MSGENVIVNIRSAPDAATVTLFTKLGYRVGKSFKAACTLAAVDEELYRITN